jgi:hypothetical protein
MADTTDFDAKCEILSDVWMDYREEEGLKELFSYADLGFPLAYAIDGGIVESTENSEKLIESTFELLLQSLNVEDTGFENITELFEAVEKKNNQ